MVRGKPQVRNERRKLSHESLCCRLERAGVTGNSVCLANSVVWIRETETSSVHQHQPGQPVQGQGRPAGSRGCPPIGESLELGGWEMIYLPPLSTQLALLCLLPVGVRMLAKPGRGGKCHKRLPKIRGRLPDLEMNSCGSLALPCPLCPIPGHPGSPRGLASLARVQNFPIITCSCLISPPTQER